MCSYRHHRDLGVGEPRVSVGWGWRGRAVLKTTGAHRLWHFILLFLLFTIPKFRRCLDRPGWSRQSQPRCSRHRPRACGFCVVRMARSFSGEVGAGPYILCIYIHSDPLLLSFFLFLLFLYLLTKILLFFPFYFVPTFYVVACLLQLIPPPSFLPAANRLRERARGGIS